MKKRIYKVKRTKRINLFNLLVFITMIISGALLVHDFIFWGILPLFKGEAYTLTYFGLFLDVIAIAMLDFSIEYIKEWF